ncbi:MAG: tRNA (5-methylaminomethyl-2-thiouridine)(34)-methyltransferase MnmD [Kordiimonadaceae bacterium]|nr:tRNA (5-methylaminomethyl-2-thiouridine)(34)-methyltransferase MnmD [Kordiimonadaceae bacterium]
MLEWKENNVPYSAEFNDIYFSVDDGLAESKAVFLDGINAPEVWIGKNEFTICELGFGTGLNFLNCLKLWLKHSGEDQTLHYLATELYPLAWEEIQKAVHWPELSECKEAFLVNYPSTEMTLYDGRVKFRLLKGDSATELSKTNGIVDAWFLDGFAPSKNADMWSERVFAEMARLSRQGTMVTTFTAAGFVRRGLNEVGFTMSKRPGYGRKREMLNGEYHGS